MDVIHVICVAAVIFVLFLAYIGFCLTVGTIKALYEQEQEQGHER